MLNKRSLLLKAVISLVRHTTLINGKSHRTNCKPNRAIELKSRNERAPPD